MNYSLTIFQDTENTEMSPCCHKIKPSYVKTVTGGGYPDQALLNQASCASSNLGSRVTVIYIKGCHTGCADLRELFCIMHILYYTDVDR